MFHDERSLLYQTEVPGNHATKQQQECATFECAKHLHTSYGYFILLCSTDPRLAWDIKYHFTVGSCMSAVPPDNVCTVRCSRAQPVQTKGGAERGGTTSTGQHSRQRLRLRGCLISATIGVVAVYPHLELDVCDAVIQVSLVLCGCACAVPLYCSCPSAYDAS